MLTSLLLAEIEYNYMNPLVLIVKHWLFYAAWARTCRHWMYQSG